MSKFGAVTAFTQGMRLWSGSWSGCVEFAVGVDFVVRLVVGLAIGLAAGVAVESNKHCVTPEP